MMWRPVTVILSALSALITSSCKPIEHTDELASQVTVDSDQVVAAYCVHLALKTPVTTDQIVSAYAKPLMDADTGPLRLDTRRLLELTGVNAIPVSSLLDDGIYLHHKKQVHASSILAVRGEQVFTVHYGQDGLEFESAGKVELNDGKLYMLTMSDNPKQHNRVIGVANVDVGIVQAGSLVDFNVQLMNNTNVRAEIARIHTECGCTLAGSTPEYIEPNESVDIQFVVDTSGKRSFMHERVVFEFHDGALLETHLSSYVAASSGIFPANLDVGYIPKGFVHSGDFYLTAFLPDMSVEGVEVTSRSEKVRVQNVEWSKRKGRDGEVGICVELQYEISLQGQFSEVLQLIIRDQEGHAMELQYVIRGIGTKCLRKWKWVSREPGVIMQPLRFAIPKGFRVQDVSVASSTRRHEWNDWKVEQTSEGDYAIEVEYPRFDSIGVLEVRLINSIDTRCKQYSFVLNKDVL